jgi:hypothetical protein
MTNWHLSVYASQINLRNPQGEGKGVVPQQWHSLLSLCVAQASSLALQSSKSGGGPIGKLITTGDGRATLVCFDLKNHNAMKTA